MYTVSNLRAARFASLFAVAGLASCTTVKSLPIPGSTDTIVDYQAGMHGSSAARIPTTTDNTTQETSRHVEFIDGAPQATTPQSVTATVPVKKQRTVWVAEHTVCVPGKPDKVIPRHQEVQTYYVSEPQTFSAPASRQSQAEGPTATGSLEVAGVKIPLDGMTVQHVVLEQHDVHSVVKGQEVVTGPSVGSTVAEVVSGVGGGAGAVLTGGASLLFSQAVNKGKLQPVDNSKTDITTTSNGGSSSATANPTVTANGGAGGAGGAGGTGGNLKVAGGVGNTTYNQQQYSKCVQNNTGSLGASGNGSGAPTQGCQGATVAGPYSGQINASGGSAVSPGTNSSATGGSGTTQGSSAPQGQKQSMLLPGDVFQRASQLIIHKTPSRGIMSASVEFAPQVM